MAKVVIAAQPEAPLLPAGPGDLLPGDSWAQDAGRVKGTGPERNLGADPRGRDVCFSPNPQTPAAWTTLSPGAGSGSCSAAVGGTLTCEEALGLPAVSPHTSSLPLTPASTKCPLCLWSRPSGCFVQTEPHNTQPSCLASYTQRTFWSPVHMAAASALSPFASNVLLYHDLFIFLLADGYHLLAVENGVIVNTCVHVFGHLFSIWLVHTSEQNC